MDYLPRLRRDVLLGIGLGNVIALEDPEAVFAGGVFNADGFTIGIDVFITAGPGAVRSYRLALFQTVFSREYEIEVAVVTQRLFVHEDGRWRALDIIVVVIRSLGQGATDRTKQQSSLQKKFFKMIYCLNFDYKFL